MNTNQSGSEGRGRKEKRWAGIECEQINRPSNGREEEEGGVARAGANANQSAAWPGAQVVGAAGAIFCGEGVARGERGGDWWRSGAATQAPRVKCRLAVWLRAACGHVTPVAGSAVPKDPARTRAPAGVLARQSPRRGRA